MKAKAGFDWLKSHICYLPVSDCTIFALNNKNVTRFGVSVTENTRHIKQSQVILKELIGSHIIVWYNFMKYCNV